MTDYAQPRRPEGPSAWAAADAVGAEPIAVQLDPAPLPELAPASPPTARPTGPEVRRATPADSADSAVPPVRRGWERDYLRRAALADLAAGLVGGAITCLVELPGTPVEVAFTVTVVPALWMASLVLVHAYERRYVGTATDEYRAMCRAGVLLLVATLLIGQVVMTTRVSPLLMAAPFVLPLALLLRHVLRLRLAARRRRGLDLHRTVVIGNERAVRGLIQAIQRDPGQGMRVVAACVSGLELHSDRPSDVAGVPVFGFPEEAMSAVDLLDADVVAVSSDPELFGDGMRRLAWSLEDREVDLVVAPGLLEVAGPRLSIRPVAGMPLLHVERPVSSGPRRFAMRAFDRLMSVVIVLVALPVILMVAVAIRLDSPGPVLFRQKRIGARGEPFQMLKFRTMCFDAESRLGELAAATDAGNEMLFKIKADPRITRVGKWLRRFSLDELPQLVNVLRGEMSLVGPRPPLPSEVEAYEPDAARRLRVRPGLTGLWQVSGRSDLSWEDSIRLDLWYVDNWSPLVDLQILFRTAKAVLSGNGAY